MTSWSFARYYSYGGDDGESNSELNLLWKIQGIDAIDLPFFGSDSKERNGGELIQLSGADGIIECYKTYLVAKGYTQVESLDYTEIFSLVAKITTIYCLIAIAAIKHCELHQLDIHNAFLHNDFYEEVYMHLSPGYTKPGDNRFCYFRKSPYGLK